MVLYKYKHFDKIQIKVIYSPSNWVTALHDGFLYSKRRRFEYWIIQKVHKEIVNVIINY